MQYTKPDYNRIYTDIINKKFPDKKNEYLALLKKEELSVIDVISLNKSVFGTDKTSEKVNQRLRSYSQADILKILDYQKQYGLNNIQLANHFKISRNTVARWKKLMF